MLLVLFWFLGNLDMVVAFVCVCCMRSSEATLRKERRKEGRKYGSNGEGESTRTLRL